MKRHAVKTGSTELAEVCPKTGKKFHAERLRHWPAVPFGWLSPLGDACRRAGLLPVTGLLALVWFLLRVVPKPSRATYPCQRVAVPLASGFVVWVAGLIGSTIAYRRARYLAHRSRYVLAATCVAAAIAIIWASVCATQSNPAAAAFSPSEPANSPIGTARGIYPGRVVWVRDASAANWDGSAGNWWDDNNTDQKAVDAMVSPGVRSLTGASSDSAAWDALFRYFNKSRGFGDLGYRKSEKIAIKINVNQDRGGDWKPDGGYPSPQVVYSLVHQLITEAGVPGSAITIYDASRYIGDPIYNKIRSNPDSNFQSVTFVVAPDIARSGRVAAVHDSTNPLQTKAGTAYLPQCVTQAKYVINLALLRAHTLCGITLCAKNHFGTTYFPDGGGWTPSPLHNSSSRSNPMGSYNCLVDLNGHKHVGGKTLLYMIDGLYPAKNQTSGVIKFASFGDDWFSSILASQDMVAIDSVGLDFLRNEQAGNPKVVDVVGNPDNYLHEAALANKPPSGTTYDPEGDGKALESLGVHEHWNNPTEKKYSRNLGKGTGIELVAVTPAETAEKQGVIAPGAKLEKLAGGFEFTEGPAVDAEGNIFFTDQPNNRIHKWSVDGKLSIFHESPGRANGLYFDKEGNLLACADLNNELWLIDMKGNVTVLVKDYKGRKLNGPNDLWIAPNGGIYFTDPLYKRPYWTRDPAMQQDGQHVYYLTPDRKGLIRVTTDLVQPNGIIGTPDGKLLYVADIGAKKAYVYQTNPDGTLSNKKLFCSMGSDGMTIDNEGNIYLTGKGVTVFDPAGKEIEHIDVPAGWTANVTFGGKDRHTLFITAQTCLYSIRMRAKGV